MKKILYLSIIGITTAINLYGQNNGQFKIREDNYIQIGYETYKSLNFGKTVTTVSSHPNNGAFGIEYWTNTSGGRSGLNFWKPWPTASNNNYLLFLGDDGNVGIGGIGDSSFKLEVNGSMRAVSYHHLSDERLKENFKPINNAMASINKIQVYEYNFKQFEQPKQDEVTTNQLKAVPNFNFDTNLHFGVKAQELEKIYPNLVSKDDNDYLSVNYTELIPILIKGVQEQDARIKDLEEKVANLKK